MKSSLRRPAFAASEPAAPRAILGFYGLTALLAFAAGYAARLGPLFALFGVLYALHLFRQAAQVRIDSPALALRLFRSNRTAGLILFLGLVAGMWRPG